MENGEGCSLETVEEGSSSLENGEKCNGKKCVLEDEEPRDSGQFFPVECSLETVEEGSSSLENGEKGNGKKCALEDEEPRDSGQFSPAPADPSPAHRRAHQRWYYAPISSDSALPHVLSKRPSKPPQRLTSSKLGEVASKSQDSAEVELLNFWAIPPMGRRLHDSRRERKIPPIRRRSHDFR